MSSLASSSDSDPEHVEVAEVAESLDTIQESASSRAVRLAAIKKAITLESGQHAKKFRTDYEKFEPSLDGSKPFFANVNVTVQLETDQDIVTFFTLFWKTLSATPVINEKNPNKAKMQKAVQAFVTNPPIVQVVITTPTHLFSCTTGYSKIASEWNLETGQSHILYLDSAKSTEITNLCDGHVVCHAFHPLPESSPFKDIDMFWKNSCGWLNKTLGVQTEADEILIFSDDMIGSM